MLKNKSYRYKNIFLYSSLQFCGNIEEYFLKHTKKLVVFVLMPRQQPNSSLIRLYIRGKLVKENKVKLSSNIFMYYFLWYVYQLFFLVKFFSKKEKIILITFHPISFFGMNLQKLIRNIEYVFWVGDYFPPINISLRLFEMLKRHYNNKVKYSCYLGDYINEKMNGRVISSKNRKTIMWGILPKKIINNYKKNRFSILFVGVVRESQGLEFLFDFMKKNKNYSVNIIGVCTDDLYKKYDKIIKKNKIGNKVFFPNKFFSDIELEELSRTCDVGIALYDIDKSSATYYTDPGKIKTYTSLGLPVIMSNVSAVAPYVKKYDCGIVIQKKRDDLSKALLQIKNNYPKYIKGVKEFNKYFYYDSYYKKSFKFIEET